MQPSVRAANLASFAAISRLWISSASARSATRLLIRHPFQLGDQRPLRRPRLDVIGRIAYEYEGGTWSEWHLLFDGGRTGWLYGCPAPVRVYEEVSPRSEAAGAGARRARERGSPGTTSARGDDRHQRRLSAPRKASCRHHLGPGALGRLPICRGSRHRGERSITRMTSPVLCWPSASFDELSLRNLRDAIARGPWRRRAQVSELRRALRHQGGRQSHGRVRSLRSIADATAPNVAILQKAENRPTIEPTDPTGSRANGTVPATR